MVHPGYVARAPGGRRRPGDEGCVSRWIRSWRCTRWGPANGVGRGVGRHPARPRILRINPNHSRAVRASCVSLGPTWRPHRVRQHCLTQARCVARELGRSTRRPRAALPSRRLKSVRLTQSDPGSALPPSHRSRRRLLPRDAAVPPPRGSHRQPPSAHCGIRHPRRSLPLPPLPPPTGADNSVLESLSPRRQFR